MQLNAIIYQWLYMHFKYMYFMLNVFNTNIWAVNERVTFSMLHTKTSGFTESWRRLDMNFINSCTKCLLIQRFDIWLHILKYFLTSTLMNQISFHIFEYKTFAVHDTSNIESDLKKKRTRPKNICTCLFMEIYKTISIWFPLTLP